jgi:uncharacterized protein YndB with AHSA1/START domain
MNTMMLKSMLGGAGLALALLAMQSATCRAEVVDKQANGFALQEKYQIKAAPEKVYAAMIEPSRWWNSAHTFSGDAKNLTLDARAGGCWCETLPGGGSALHMTVVNVVPGKLVRMRGALGPFQPTGMDGAMNVTFKPKDGGTLLEVSYNLGGYVNGGFDVLATSADGVLNLQFYRLKQLIETGSADTPRPQGEQP